MDECATLGVRWHVTRRRIFQTLNDGLGKHTVSDLNESPSDHRRLTVFPLPLWPTMTVRGE